MPEDNTTKQAVDADNPEAGAVVEEKDFGLTLRRGEDLSIEAPARRNTSIKEILVAETSEVKEPSESNFPVSPIVSPAKKLTIQNFEQT